MSDYLCMKVKGYKIQPLADLEGAVLKETNLRYADLEGANLRKANLYKANLQGADLKGANLKGTYLEGANLKELYDLGISCAANQLI